MHAAMKRPGLPAAHEAILRALQLSGPDGDLLTRLDDSGWRATLDFCDRSRLTLALRRRTRDKMPLWVRERTDQNLDGNRKRLQRLLTLYRELAGALGSLKFVALKGVTQIALSGECLEDRVQYDIDLFATLPDALAARELLLHSGFESLTALEHFPTDHLAPLIRKTGWEWRGDFFDPEIPTAVELHFRLWDDDTERLPAAGLEGFWERRAVREIGGLALPVLHPVDALGYSALHILRHLLRGNLDAYSVFELGSMLDRRAADGPFWEQWEQTHSPELQRLEAVSFQLARSWFGCALAPPAVEAIAKLPEPARRW